jgi:Family of unknown function (DUF6599)
MRVPRLLLVTLLIAGTAHAQDYLDCHFAPGWEQSGQKRQYTADNLYDYKDGAAEGYLIFGFSRMTGITCKSGQDTLDIDVSEMSDPEAAWGILATNLAPDQPIEKLGMAGQIGPQSAAFAKGKYYVELVEVAADPQSDHSALLRIFTQNLLTSLDGTNAQPEALAWFPAGNSSPVRVVPESVLGLKELKRGYVAKYAQGQAFIVQEASAEVAGQVFQRLQRHFADPKSASIGNESFRTSDKYLGALCIFRKGRFLAGFTNSLHEDEAVQQAGRLVARIP